MSSAERRREVEMSYPVKVVRSRAGYFQQCSGAPSAETGRHLIYSHECSHYGFQRIYRQPLVQPSCGVRASGDAFVALSVHAGQRGLPGGGSGGMPRCHQSGRGAHRPAVDGRLQAGTGGEPHYDHPQAGGSGQSPARTSGSDDFHFRRRVLQPGRRLPWRTGRSGGGFLSGGIVRGLGKGGGTGERLRAAGPHPVWRSPFPGWRSTPQNGAPGPVRHHGGGREPGPSLFLGGAGGPGGCPDFHHGEGGHFRPGQCNGSGTHHQPGILQGCRRTFPHPPVHPCSGRRPAPADGGSLPGDYQRAVRHSGDADAGGI